MSGACLRITSLYFLFQYAPPVPPGIGVVPPGELALPVCLLVEQGEVGDPEAAAVLLAAPGKLASNLSDF